MRPAVAGIIRSLGGSLRPAVGERVTKPEKKYRAPLLRRGSCMQTPAKNDVLHRGDIIKTEDVVLFLEQIRMCASAYEVEDM